MIVYFSGTGNSRYCAQMLADRLGDEERDSFHFIRDGIAAELCSDRPWVFVSPTYAWQLPHIFAEFIRSGSFSGSREAYFVMTCGSDLGSAARKNRALCEEKGLSYQGTLKVVMPENYIALYDAPGPARAKELVDAARPVLESGIDCIRAGRSFSESRVSGADRFKSGIVNTIFYRFIVKSKHFTVLDSCVGCGHCAENCVGRSVHALHVLHLRLPGKRH